MTDRRAEGIFVTRLEWQIIAFGIVMFGIGLFMGMWLS